MNLYHSLYLVGFAGQENLHNAIPCSHHNLHVYEETHIHVDEESNSKVFVDVQLRKKEH